MKNTGLFFLFLISSVLFSCQFSEDIYIDEYGSGKIEFHVDASGIMQMVGGEAAKSFGNEEIDSTISFKEVFKQYKDSIAKMSKEEQERLKSFESFAMNIKMSKKTQKLDFNIFTEFNNVSELQDMMTAFNKLESLKNQKNPDLGVGNNPLSSMFNKSNSELSYAFNNNVFRRTVKVVDEKLQSQVKDSLGEMASMLSAATYKLNYHFPKKIKSVSNEKAMFSNDRKSVTIEYPFLTYLTDPEAMSVEIELEQ